MGDASTSASATPTSILICREDSNDLFVDAGDSPAGGTGFSLAGDDHLLLLDRDEEYVALMLSKEGAAASGSDVGGGSASGEEIDEWMKAACTVCAEWIFKTNTRFLLSRKAAYVVATYPDRFLAR